MTKLLNEFKPAINNSVLTLYRLFSIVTLYAVLAGVLAYGISVGFYALSGTWVAPIIVSNQDKEALDLTGKLLTTESSVQDLKLDVAKLEETVVEAQRHKAALENLRPAIDAAILREDRFREETGPALVRLAEHKESDNVRTQRMLEQSAVVEAAVQKELAVGLVTKTDAIQAETEFVKSNSDLTDSRIGALLLKDRILDKTTPTTTYLETLDKRTDLESEITTLGITIVTARHQITAEREQIQQLNKAVEIAKRTPYWAAIQEGNINLVLVPYSNQAAAVEGAPVYDCYLSFVVCRQVGTLTRKFGGEQQATHPIFRTQLRGFLAELNLNDHDSAKSQTLFLGAKPLLF